MILIPIFMNKPSFGYTVASKEDKEIIQHRRDDILNILKVNPNGLTIQDIAIKTNKEVRQVSAILTVLKKHGKVYSIYTNSGKLWKTV